VVSVALQGDASVCYLKDASVPLAITLLDGADFRPGCVASRRVASRRVALSRVASRRVAFCPCAGAFV
jgi:hypothetical protein